MKLTVYFVALLFGIFSSEANTVPVDKNHVAVAETDKGHVVHEKSTETSKEPAKVEVAEKNSVRLYLEDPLTGIYRTEQGDFVRMFRTSLIPRQPELVARSAAPGPRLVTDLAGTAPLPFPKKSPFPPPALYLGVVPGSKDTTDKVADVGIVTSPPAGARFARYLYDGLSYGGYGSMGGYGMGMGGYGMGMGGYGLGGYGGYGGYGMGGSYGLGGYGLGGYGLGGYGY